MPLAIELAASELLTGPAEPADLRPRRTTPERAVDEAVQQSLDQLSASALRTAVRVGLLPAGFTPGLACGVGPEGSSGTAVLQELLAHGLVVSETSGTNRRLRFPDSVRAALVPRHEASDRAAVRATILGIFGAVRPDLAAPVSVPALSAAVDELPNARALLGRMTDLGRYAERLELATWVADAWCEDGRWAEGEAQLARALASVRPDPEARSLDEQEGTSVEDPASVIGVEPLAWARAVLARSINGPYAGPRHLDQDLLQAQAIAAEAGDLALEGRLTVQVAHALSYAGDVAAAAPHVARLSAIADELGSEYLAVGARALGAVDRLLQGDPAAARAALAPLAVALEGMGAPSEAARARRLLSVACRAAGEPIAALDALVHAERLALEASARGVLATVRSEIADLRAQQGEPVEDALRAALEAALAVGSVRSAGILRVRLGEQAADPALIALGTLDLWRTDASWAAAALATLLPRLEPGHALLDLGPAVIAHLAGSWGLPLDAREAALVAAHEAAAAPLPDEWELEVIGLLSTCATSAG